ncbi:hypothetical protein V1525DRAFT_393761 [Lipomyces kononenkoae]|uniref:Uncharacterized protein n=1 Tax=Lipomyces kononenkoae TaxID=34357 RepID=A0ACC3TBQ9_LIPKO
MPQQELYCICRKPDTGQWMIACDFCDDWYHGSCVSIHESQADLIETYACPSCTAKGLGTTAWKRKCRLPGCNQPALVDGDKKSKFCGPDHGVAWFKLNIEAHSKDADDGLRNSAISPSDLSAILSSISNVREFKQLGDVTPTPASPNFTLDDQQRLSTLNAQKAEIHKKLRYLEHKTSYIEYAKLRATALKTVCGFDRKLVWDDAEWAEWCDSDEGARILNRIREFKASQDEQKMRASVADDANGVGNGDKKKRGRRPKQQASIQLNIQDILNVVGSTDEDAIDDVCMLERRRCSRHASWQHIRTEEVELDERVLRDNMVKIEREEQAIRQRAAIRSFKDSTRNAGRCIVVN